MKTKMTKSELVGIIIYFVLMSWCLEFGLFEILGQMETSEAIQQTISLNILFLYLGIFSGIVIGILYKLGIWKLLFDDGACTNPDGEKS